MCCGTRRIAPAWREAGVGHGAVDLHDRAGAVARSATASGTRAPAGVWSAARDWWTAMTVSAFAAVFRPRDASPGTSVRGEEEL